ncbi:MAG: type II toxin-antitoxin system RelE/ParE family toxin [Mesorhizobium sp.]|nr:type II toxin-antitoxin system RelE/ParE family toxin [Mesorhizobium sp.]
MKLVWSALARRELADIVSYIWLDNPAAAKRIRARVEDTADHLQAHPFAGRPGKISGTREALAHPSYRIVYQLSDETVLILRVMHTSRQWPPIDDGGD